MGNLEEVSLEDLHAALERIERKRPTQRLLAAIAYKHGVSQTELAEWFDVERKTIYNWLSRVESGDLPEAVQDTPRTGRNRKLSESQLATFAETVQEPPSEVGLDEPYWTPSLVQDYLRETFDVHYSIPSCRRLMKEAGLRFHPYTGDAGTDMNASSTTNSTSVRNGGVWKPTDE